MKYVWIVIFVMASLLPKAATAASDIETRDLGGGVSLKINKTNKTISMLSGSKTVFVADMATNRLYQFNNDGLMVSDSSLSSHILAQAGGNLAAAERITDSFNRMVYTMPARRISSVSSDPYPCMMSPCPPGYTPTGNPWLPSTAPWQPVYTETGPGIGGEGPTIGEYDELMFLRWREDRCDAGHSAGSISLWLASEVAFVASCLATPFTIVAGAGCAAGFVAATYTANEIDEARADCALTYPGIGNW
jgi:hypothetical protein